MGFMADSKTQEPSIEEILSSIRQIINEEEQEASPVADVAPKPTHLAGNDDDVLDLADIVKPAMPPVVQAPEPVKAPEPEPEPEPIADDLDFAEPVFAKEESPMNTNDIDAMFDTPAPAPAPEPTPDAPIVAEDVAPTLVDDAIAGAVAASLSRVAHAAEVMIDRKHAVGAGSVTLEDVVREMIRPMIKGWLDENLPPLVERLVQREIEKIGRRV